MTSLISLQTCNPGGQQCNSGSTTIGARLASGGPDLGRVTLSCTPASPLTVIRMQQGLITCTIRVPSDFGSTSIALRSVTISAPPAGWGITTTPVGTVALNNSVIISPNQTLTAGQSWSFTITFAPSCTASASSSWSMSSRIATVNGAMTGTEVAGPTATYAATATTPVQTVSASLVSSATDWNFMASFDPQSQRGSLTYRVIGAGCMGWNVTVTANPFTYSGAIPGSSLPLNSLQLISAGAPEVLSGSGVGVAGSSSTGSLETPRKVLSATAGNGNGTYQQNLEMEMTLPAGTTVGTYRSTITVTTAAAP